MSLPAARHLAVVLCLAALGGLRCGGSGGTPSPTVLTIGEETLVILTAGSLSPARPTNDPERVQALADYVRGHPELFGPAAPPADGVDFVQTGTSARVRGSDGETWILLALHQTVAGAPVVDEFLMGAFALAPGGEELRRVRGLARDPGTLPQPPDPATAPRDRAIPVANDLVVTHGLSADLTEISTEPVVSSKHDIAGYLVSQFRPRATGSFDTFEAIVDSVDLDVEVIEKKPECDDLLAVPEGVIVAKSNLPTYPVFTPSRSIRIHAVRTSNNDGTDPAPITPAEVKIWVDAANSVWWPQAGIWFAFDHTLPSDDFEEKESTVLNNVPTTAYEASNYRLHGNTWALLFQPEKLVVYFRGTTGPGWSWGPTSTFHISMPSYTLTALNKPGEGGWIRNDTALSHEIGHFMGLAHTHSGEACGACVPTNSNGDVNGQEFNTVDDDVLDTFADLRDDCYPTPSLTCVGGSVSFNGNVWFPPWANVMSYHDCLPEDLTPDQLAAIERTLLHPKRAVLLVD